MGSLSQTVTMATQIDGVTKHKRSKNRQVGILSAVGTLGTQVDGVVELTMSPWQPRQIGPLSAKVTM